MFLSHAGSNHQQLLSSLFSGLGTLVRWPMVSVRFIVIIVPSVNEVATETSIRPHFHSSREFLATARPARASPTVPAMLLTEPMQNNRITSWIEDVHHERNGWWSSGSCAPLNSLSVRSHWRHKAVLGGNGGITCIIRGGRPMPTLIQLMVFRGDNLIF